MGSMFDDSLRFATVLNALVWIIMTNRRVAWNIDSTSSRMYVRKSERERERATRTIASMRFKI
jgi:hypothetical protein